MSSGEWGACAMLGAGLHTPSVPKAGRSARPRDLTSSPCCSPIRAPSAPASGQLARHRAQGAPITPGAAASGRAPERRGPARRGRSGQEDPGLSGWAGRRAFFPQRAGGAGRGAGRGGRPGRSAGRSSSCGGSLVRPVLPLPGCSVPARAPPRTRTGTCTGSDAAPRAPLAGGGCATMADKEARRRRPGSRGERAARGPGAAGRAGEGGRARPGAPQPHRGSRESGRPRARLPQPPFLLGSGAAPRRGREVRRGQRLEGGPPVTCSAPRWGCGLPRRGPQPLPDTSLPPLQDVASCGAQCESGRAPSPPVHPLNALQRTPALAI